MTAGFHRPDGERRSRCFGVWGTLGSTGRWPEVVNLWEHDQWSGVAGAFAHQTRGHGGMQDPELERWWNKAQEMRSGGFDRLLVAADYSPTIDDVIGRGIVGWEAFRHEIVDLVPGEARNFLAAVESEWAPVVRPMGVELVGAYRTALRDDSEAILIWAVRDWETWAQAEAEIDSGEAGLGWRAKIRGLVRHIRTELMCSAPRSPTQTGRQP
ncbi:MAG TPA: hypothetical protein VGL30_11315 [Phenylobacterium sp.]